MVATGFQYYTTDSNRFFTQAYRRLKRKHGAAALAVLDYIIAEIFRENGYYAEYSVDFVEDVAEYWDVEASEVRDIIESCIAFGIFDQMQYEENEVLTSQDIQMRYIKISALLKRKNVEILPQYNCTLSEQFRNNSGVIPEQFRDNSGYNIILNNITRDKDKDNVVVVTREEDADCIGKQQQLIDEDISRELCERYMFLNQRKVKALDIVDRFWRTNSAFGWRSPKHGKLINPEYAIRIWKPNAEEEGGYACKDLELVRKFYEFATLWGGNLRRELLSNFNDLTIEGNELQLTFHSEDAIDALEGLLIADKGAKEAFLSTFGVKMITYLLEE